MPLTEERQEKVFSRRQLLKAIAATGGAVAASALLPSEWSPPGIKVGVLPVSAQQLTGVIYRIYCDADPQGGGDIILTNGVGTVANITATAEVVSGTGPVAGIPVTMSAEAATGYPLPDSFDNLPRNAVTTASGIAYFGDLTVYGSDGQAFNLRFDFGAPVDDNCVCGRYDLVELIPE